MKHREHRSSETLYSNYLEERSERVVLTELEMNGQRATVKL